MFATAANRILVAGVTAVLIVLGSPASSQAEPLVLPGWDLFQTDAGTHFRGMLFRGVPLVTHDFAGVGVRQTFQTDTIVRRTDSVAGPTGLTGLVVEALQLRSTAATPGGFLFLTLQSVRGGPSSTGSMTINFGPEGTPHGAFSSFFDVFFDVRLGSLTGSIIESDVKRFTSTGAWTHFPEAGAVEIPGVNTFLNGSNRLNDFHARGAIVHVAPDASHIVSPAEVPEPASLLLVGAGLLGVAARVRNRRART